MSNQSSNSQANERNVTATECTRGEQFYRPNVDILELPDELVVLADMPGVKGQDVDIQFEDGQLTIHGPVQAHQAEQENCLLREYGVGAYYRTFQVSEQVDTERIHATFANGVLTLHLPKVPAAKPRRIVVGAAG